MDWSTLVPTAVGVLLGGLGPVLVVLIQGKQQRKTELIRVAMEAALREHQAAIDFAVRAQKRAAIPPPASYLHHNWRLLELLEQGKLTEAELRKLFDEDERVVKMYQEVNRAAGNVP